MHASNFHLIVHGNNDEQLEAALSIALDDQSVVAWADEDGWFCCYWSRDIEGVTPTPFKVVNSTIAHTVKNWLREQPEAQTGHYRIDGDYVFEGWQLRAGYYAAREVSPSDNVEYEVFRIKPAWAHYAK